MTALRYLPKDNGVEPFALHHLGGEVYQGGERTTRECLENLLDGCRAAYRVALARENVIACADILERHNRLVAVLKAQSDQRRAAGCGLDRRVG